MELMILLNLKKYENGSSEIFKANGYQVEVISFKIKIPLYNGDLLNDGSGWIFRIEKVSEVDEKLKTYCLLDKKDNKIVFDIATGENLDAIQADDGEWTLHIGTEDGEILRWRAEANDWFPIRIKDEVDFYKSVSEMRQNGFVTNVPSLRKGEKMHIQYLAAYDRSDDQKVNTWLAVDESKRNLENWIGIW
jgi:hypothetical protein